MTAGVVDGLHRTPGRRAELEALHSAVVLTNAGIEGDHHNRAGSSRQVMIIESEVLDDLNLKPGDVREQLAVRGLGTLAPGDVLEIGAVRLEIVKPRVPCTVMDGVRPGLRRELVGRAGWCARAVTGGEIALGDRIARSRVDDPDWLHDFRAALAEWEAAPPRPQRDGEWGEAEVIAHLIGWAERAVQRLDAIADGDIDHPLTEGIDAFNAASVARLLTDGTTPSQLYRLHDVAATSVVEAARRYGDLAEDWVSGLADHYREHA